MKTGWLRRCARPGGRSEYLMIEGLDSLFEDSGQAGLAELRLLLNELLGGPEATGSVLESSCLQSRRPRVFRLRLAHDRRVYSLVVKRLEPVIAQRNELVITRWLPAAGLGESGPRLLGVAAARSGECVWHVYEDLGDWALDATESDRCRVKAAAELIARIHTRFSNHPLLPECRLYGGDLGIAFFTANVLDAIRGLEFLRPPRVELSPERLGLRDRLLERLQRHLKE